MKKVKKKKKNVSRAKPRRGDGVLSKKKNRIRQEQGDMIFDSKSGKTDALFVNEPEGDSSINHLEALCYRPKKNKFGFPSNRFLSILTGLVFAGLFCSGIYVLATTYGVDALYPIGNTLNPTNCSPGGTYCKVETPLTSSNGLLLDQTTPQTVSSGTPIFSEGISVVGGSVTQSIAGQFADGTSTVYLANGGYEAVYASQGDAYINLLSPVLATVIGGTRGTWGNSFLKVVDGDAYLELESSLGLLYAYDGAVYDLSIGGPTNILETTGNISVGSGTFNNYVTAGDLSIVNIQTGGDTALKIDSASGVVYKDASSLRYKKDVEPLVGDFSKILQAQPVSFNYISNNRPDTGYIAEDFDALGLKGLVVYDKQGRADSIKYDKIPLYILEVVKQQQLDIQALQQRLGITPESIAVTPAGTVGDGEVSSVSPSSLADLLKSLGMQLADGVASLKEIVADKLTVATARVSGLEMVDKATGSAYCTWIENGEWQKAEGDCSSVGVGAVVAVSPSQAEQQLSIAKQTQQKFSEIKKEVQQAVETAKEAQNAAEEVQEQVEEVQEQIQQQPEVLNIVSVDSIADISVEFRTNAENIELPESVSVTLSDGSAQNLSVTWDAGTPAYNGEISGTYTFSGVIAFSGNITNTENINAVVNVVVAEDFHAEIGEAIRDAAVEAVEAVGEVIGEASSSLLNGAKNLLNPDSLLSALTRPILNLFSK